MISQKNTEKANMSYKTTNRLWVILRLWHNHNAIMAAIIDVFLLQWETEVAKIKCLMQPSRPPCPRVCSNGFPPHSSVLFVACLPLLLVLSKSFRATNTEHPQKTQQRTHSLLWQELPTEIILSSMHWNTLSCICVFHPLIVRITH